MKHQRKSPCPVCKGSGVIKNVRKGVEITKPCVCQDPAINFSYPIQQLTKRLPGHDVS